MNLRRFQEKDPEINLTPLIDVVFLLLIFFMVSTTFKREAEITVNLPEASAEASEEQKEAIEITIDAKGHYFVNQKRLVNTQIATLKRAIRSAAGSDDKPPLIISGDARTPHQAVVTAMDAARQLGFTHLSIATKQADSKL